jgi:hypothetical protein
MRLIINKEYQLEIDKGHFEVGLSIGLKSTPEELEKWVKARPTDHLNRLLEANITDQNYEACQIIINELDNRKHD